MLPLLYTMCQTKKQPPDRRFYLWRKLKCWEAAQLPHQQNSVLNVLLYFFLLKRVHLQLQHHSGLTDPGSRGQVTLLRCRCNHCRLWGHFIHSDKVLLQQISKAALWCSLIINAMSLEGDRSHSKSREKLQTTPNSRCFGGVYVWFEGEFLGTNLSDYNS